MTEELSLPLERDRGEERRPLREAFVNDLYVIMERKNVSQRALALHLDLSSHTVINRWRHFIGEPMPDVVFEIERFLDVSPGSLSQHLGYVPLVATRVPRLSVEKAIAADAVLPDWGKEAIITLYGQIMASLGRGRRR